MADGTESTPSNSVTGKVKPNSPVITALGAQ